MTALSDRVRRRLRPAYRQIAGMLPPRLRRHYLYLVSVGVPLNLRHPRAFTEKVSWRILHDRRPGIAERCDKMRMKEIAASAITDGSLRIPATLWHGTDVAEVPAELWEGEWVLKPNHGSGEVILSPGPGSIEQLREATAGWLEPELADKLGEWGYSQARHEIVLEERLPVDGVPDDYKIYCFDGRADVVLVTRDRFGGSTQVSIYDTDWNRQPVRCGTADLADVPRPPRLDEMLEIAERLSAGWDFMRVDLYAIDGEIWFGELTPYSSGGTGRYHPRSFDRALGDRWTLPSLEEVAA